MVTKGAYGISNRARNNTTWNLASKTVQATKANKLRRLHKAHWNIQDTLLILMNGKKGSQWMAREAKLNIIALAEER